MPYKIIWAGYVDLLVSFDTEKPAIGLQKLFHFKYLFTVLYFTCLDPIRPQPRVPTNTSFGMIILIIYNNIYIFSENLQQYLHIQ